MVLTSKIVEFYKYKVLRNVVYHNATAFLYFLTTFHIFPERLRIQKLYVFSFLIRKSGSPAL